MKIYDGKMSLPILTPLLASKTKENAFVADTPLMAMHLNENECALELRLEYKLYIY